MINYLQADRFLRHNINMTRDDWDNEAILLDTNGLKCPLPVLKLRKKMKPMASGDIVKMSATDKASFEDVQAFCDSNGHDLLGQYEEMGGTKFIHYVQKRNE